MMQGHRLKGLKGTDLFNSTRRSQCQGKQESSCQIVRIMWFNGDVIAKVHLSDEASGSSSDSFLLASLKIDRGRCGKGVIK